MTHAEALVYAAAFPSGKVTAFLTVLKLRGVDPPSAGSVLMLKSKEMLAEFKAFGEERRK